MLTYFYVFSLIVGFVLLAASILLGGHDDADVEAGGDADASADGHGDADATAEGFDKDATIGGHGDFAGFLTTFLSLRFWTFFLAFFGLTGLTLDGLDLVGSSAIALGVAIATGAVIGVGAVAAFRKLGADTTGVVANSADYIGKTARVVVPIQGTSLGKVRVDVKGNQVDLLATGLDGDGFEGREEVLIVEMDGNRVRVARLDGKKVERS